MSRKSAFSDAIASAAPATMHAKRAPSGIESQTVSRASGSVDQAQHDHHDEHHREADEVRGDNRKGNQLPREAHLSDQVRVLDQAARGRLRGGREEDPRGEPAEEEEPVVAAPDLRDAPEEREDEQVDGHEHERVQQRPCEPEDRAAVLRAHVAAEQAREELSVTEDVGIDGHRGDCRDDSGLRLDGGPARLFP